MPVGTSRSSGQVIASADINAIAVLLNAVEAALAGKAPSASPTFTGTVTGVTKAHVGLGNADNTSDASKPISTATQTALDLKQDAATALVIGGSNNEAKAGDYAPSYTDVPIGSLFRVFKSSGSWPARPSNRGDIYFEWIGAAPQPAVVTSGTGGMREGDTWVEIA